MDEDSSLKDRIKKLEEERDKLRKELWALKRRKYRRASVILIGLGLLSFIAALMLQNMFFEYLALGSFFIGFTMLYIGVEPYVKSLIATQSLVPPLRTIQHILNDLKAQPHAIYLPPTDGISESRVYVPLEDGPVPPPRRYVKPDKALIPGGVLLVPTGITIAEMIEEEMGEPIKGMPLEKMLGKLSRIVTEGMELADDFKQRIEGEGIHAVILRHKYAYLCKLADGEKKMSWCDLAGCPMCSCIATLITKCVEKPVILESHEYDEKTGITELTFRITEFPK